MWHPVDQDGVRRLLDEEDAQIVEVLPPQEYGQEHIAGAVNIPLKGFTADAVGSLDRSRPVIVYCNGFL